jgi:hypothetical protein
MVRPPARSCKVYVGKCGVPGKRECGNAWNLDVEQAAAVFLLRRTRLKVPTAASVGCGPGPGLACSVGECIVCIVCIDEARPGCRGSDHCFCRRHQVVSESCDTRQSDRTLGHEMGGLVILVKPAEPPTGCASQSSHAGGRPASSLADDLTSSPYRAHGSLL